MNESESRDAHVVSGEFFTDGANFVFRLQGTPISGSGPSPQAAFDDLMRAQSATGDLQHKLRMLARDQQGEQVRASLIRMTMTWLIALTIVGGLVAGIVATSPKIAADIAEATISAMDAPDPQLTPQQREQMSTLLQPAPDSSAAP